MSIDKTARQLIVEVIQNTDMSENLVVAVENYIDGNENVRLLNCRYEDYSKYKLGFSGAHKKLEIAVQKSDADEPPQTVTFFVKSRLDNFEKMAVAIGENRLFLKESNFYSTIAPLFEKHCKTEKWHPVCYFADGNVVVMEDLRSQGYELHGRMADDAIGLKSTLAALARLHASSIVAEDCLSRNTEKAASLMELYPGLLDDVMFARGALVSAWCSTSIDIACVLAEKLNHDPKKIQESYEHMPNLLKPSRIHRNVVCHGDLWCNNLMIRDKSSECILLDFQFVRYAPLAIDLLQLLHLNATRSFREEHAKELVEFYRRELEATIGSQDSSAKVPELADILAAMEDLRLFGLFAAVIYLPASLMDPQAFAEYTKDADSFWNFMFCTRTEQALAHMEVNETYKSRIHEAVVELVEYIDGLSEAK